MALPPAGEVHVWQAWLAVPRERLNALAVHLSEDERARAQRFHFDRDRERYVAARGLLRELLAQYLNAAPHALRLVYSPYGKPVLADGLPLRFNVSHSADLALFAFAQGRDVGVDVERERADLAGEQIAERFFSAAEVTALRGLPAEERTTAFFRCWTRKEAFVKARGEGLSLPLNRFDVSLAPAPANALLCTRPDPREAERWAVQPLAAPPGFCAALAAEAPPIRIVRRAAALNPS